MKTTVYKLSIALILFFSLFYSTTIITNAMCAYNLTNFPDPTVANENWAHTKFNCGIFCANTWNIDPNERKCRPSTKGKVDACIGWNYICMLTCDCIRGGPCDSSVETHGWVDVEPNSSKGLYGINCVERKP